MFASWFAPLVMTAGLVGGDVVEAVVISGEYSPVEVAQATPAPSAPAPKPVTPAPQPSACDSCGACDSCSDPCSECKKCGKPWHAKKAKPACASCDECQPCAQTKLHCVKCGIVKPIHSHAKCATCEPACETCVKEKPVHHHHAKPCATCEPCEPCATAAPCATCEPACKTCHKPSHKLFAKKGCKSDCAACGSDCGCGDAAPSSQPSSGPQPAPNLKPAPVPQKAPSAPGSPFASYEEEEKPGLLGRFLGFVGGRKKAKMPRTSRPTHEEIVVNEEVVGQVVTSQSQCAACDAKAQVQSQGVSVTEVVVAEPAELPQSVVSSPSSVPPASVLQTTTDVIVPSRALVETKVAKGEVDRSVVPASSGTGMDHAADYAWIQGKLEKVHVRGGAWVVRYAPLDREDVHGGRVVLAKDGRVDAFKEGDVVRVHGEVLREKSSSYLSAPLYRISQMQLVKPAAVK